MAGRFRRDGERPGVPFSRRTALPGFRQHGDRRPRRAPRSAFRFRAMDGMAVRRGGTGNDGGEGTGPGMGGQGREHGRACAGRRISVGTAEDGGVRRVAQTGPEICGGGDQSTTASGSCLRATDPRRKGFRPSGASGRARAGRPARSHCRRRRRSALRRRSGTGKEVLESSVRPLILRQEQEPDAKMVQHGPLRQPRQGRGTLSPTARAIARESRRSVSFPETVSHLIHNPTKKGPRRVP